MCVARGLDSSVQGYLGQWCCRVLGPSWWAAGGETAALPALLSQCSLNPVGLGVLSDLMPSECHAELNP